VRFQSFQRSAPRGRGLSQGPRLAGGADGATTKRPPEVSLIDRTPACGSFGNCRERSLSVEVQQAAEQAALHESVRPKARPRLCSARHSDTTIHSSEKPRPRHAHHSRVKVQAGVRFEFRSSEEEYETRFTSQSVQPKPGAGTDRQPASDTVNTGLL
jgi:hypothetical protein